MIIHLSKTYAESYTAGYQARQEDLCVNPYVLNFDEEDRYAGWRDGWKDADMDLELQKH